MLNEANRAEAGGARSSHQAKLPDDAAEPLCKGQIH
jgi:hypothetical protein